MDKETILIENSVRILGKEEEDWYRFIETLRVFNSLQLPSNSKILDIGTWRGYLTLAIKQQGYDVYGIDNTTKFSETLINHGVKFYLCDIELDHMSFNDGFFDCILFTEVIEHLHPFEVKRILKDIHRFLKRDGVIILSTVNQASLQNTIRIIFGKKILFHPDHVREYVIGEIVDLLKSAKFKISEKRFLHVFDRPRRYTSFSVNFFRFLLLPIKFLIPRFRSLMLVVAKK